MGLAFFFLAILVLMFLMAGIGLVALSIMIFKKNEKPIIKSLCIVGIITGLILSGIGLKGIISVKDTFFPKLKSTSSMEKYVSKKIAEDTTVVRISEDNKVNKYEVSFNNNKNYKFIVYDYFRSLPPLPDTVEVCSNIASTVIKPLFDNYLIENGLTFALGIKVEIKIVEYGPDNGCNRIEYKINKFNEREVKEGIDNFIRYAKSKGIVLKNDKLYGEISIIN